MKQLTEQMQQANLSEKEQAVMEKILSNISNTVFLSGAQLAEYCDVSAPYITRLVRKLGYTKFSEFKEVLSERYRRATSPYDMFRSFSDESGITDVVKESLLQDIGALYIDKSSRLCATMKVYHYLSTRTPYVVGDMVKGRVYEISDRFGVFVAVDDKYSALIPAREAKGKYRPGKILELRVSEVKEDGKMNVTDRQKAYLQINEDAENVLEVINEFAGVLPFDDKASPEVIQREFGLSKGAFKRAIGHLMKEGKVEIKDKRIYAK